MSAMEVARAAAEARRFGRYTLVAKIAIGGMAEIFLARLAGDGGFEKLVCIKRILPHLARDPQFVAMFLDEARVAARISHPNVCQVFELGEFNKQYFIAMEYLEGVPLSCFRRTDYYPRRPDPRLIAGFGVQACEGLHHAHQLKRADGQALGLVHRDISPQNLFVTIDGIVKVLDFGIAKATDASAKTSTGAVKGTYAYMAPEQLRNELLDRRTDVWAMGTVLWELLAQRHLFKRDNEFLTFQAITTDPIPNICELRPDVPPLLGDAIARALSRNRDDRFATARSLGEAISQAVAPLGGAFPSSAVSDTVVEAFADTVGEQQEMLRVAREGGQFDLDAESPMVGHGTQLATTPVSSLRRRLEEAQAEVAQYAAVQNVLSDLDEPSSSGFTPPPRLPPPQTIVEHSRSGPYSVAPAEWRAPYQSGPVPVPTTPQTGPMATPQVIVKHGSRLPWIITLLAVGVAGATGAALYTQRTHHDDPPPAPPEEHVVAMKAEPAPAPAPEPAPAPAPEPAAAATAPTPAPAPKIEKPKPVVVAVAKPKPVPSPSPSPPQTPVTPTTTTPHPSGPPGFITIDSAPVYATIFIDGKSYGETPLVHLSLAAGKHAVRAVSPSGATRNVTITIDPGKTAPPRRIEW
jgi:serine/threonine-protein kinase